MQEGPTVERGGKAGCWTVHEVERLQGGPALVQVVPLFCSGSKSGANRFATQPLDFAARAKLARPARAARRPHRPRAQWERDGGGSFFWSKSDHGGTP